MIRVSVAVFCILMMLAAASQVAQAQLTMMNVGTAGANGGGVNPCTGTIDATKGCPMPMLGM
jgi:hypothetical protein